MRDRVAEVLDQRAALESGAAAGVVLSVFLHATAAAIVPVDTKHITSPMVGTLYRSPSPEAPPYVEVLPRGPQSRQASPP